MELVDNAIDSRVKGRQLEVLLQVHASYFVIETRDGEGMGPAELERNNLDLAPVFWRMDLKWSSIRRRLGCGPG
jgi:hypothetical protein